MKGTSMPLKSICTKKVLFAFALMEEGHIRMKLYQLIGRLKKCPKRKKSKKKKKFDVVRLLHIFLCVAKLNPDESISR
jgi:hypothetical protein